MQDGNKTSSEIQTAGGRSRGDGFYYNDHMFCVHMRYRGEREEFNGVTNESIPPPDQFVEQANVTEPSIYDQFERNWPECWERAAALIEWGREYDTVLEPREVPPYYEWFSGGRLNAAHNCIDRHVRDGRGDTVAVQWLGEQGGTRSYTYTRLQREVNDLAAALRSLGVAENETVALYMPRIPELLVAMLACARLGAVHVVVFSEYSADILASFMSETGAQVLLTCDRYYKNGESHDLASKAAAGVDALNREVTTVTVERAGGATVPGGRKYDALLAEHTGGDVGPVDRDANAPLFICYASGPVSEPMGMAHVTGEYLAYVTWTAHAVLDLEPGDTLWCPAGIEWITGHSYVVYGALACGATTVVYEGGAATPSRHRPWQIIDEYDVTQFYTTPTAIRTFRDWGTEFPESHDLSSLRLLGTVGQRIDPETWLWFYTHVGNGQCPVVDTWYQAETGGITLSTLPGICDMKPGAVGPPLPGIDATVVDANGAKVQHDEAGYLTFDRPWPGFFRPVGTADEQAMEHWTEFGNPGDEWVYFAEDGATVDGDDYITILGRLDDVINIGYFSKNRVHVSEIEQVIEDVDAVESATVVAAEHEIKGETPYAFVVVDDGDRSHARRDIRDRIEQELAAPACPEDVYVVSELPQTYAGGVLRQVLKDLLNGEQLGDTDLLRNPGVLDRIAVEIRHDSSPGRR